MLRAIFVSGLLATVLPHAALSGERVNNPRALVVRGMNVTNCNAASIGAGSNPQVGVNGDVQNLSVSCSPDGKTSLKTLRKPLPNPHYCWTTLKDLEKRNGNVALITDPTPGNAFHCIVNDITPNEMKKALHYVP